MGARLGTAISAFSVVPVAPKELEFLEGELLGHPRILSVSDRFPSRNKHPAIDSKREARNSAGLRLVRACLSKVRGFEAHTCLYETQRTRPGLEGEAREGGPTDPPKEIITGLQQGPGDRHRHRRRCGSPPNRSRARQQPIPSLRKGFHTQRL